MLGTWSGKATGECRLALLDTNPVLPRASSQQACVISYKGDASGLIGSFVDSNQVVSGTFNDWFAATNSDFPFLAQTTLIVRCGLPTNWFDVTPWTGTALATNDWRGMTNVLARLLWTRLDGTAVFTNGINCIGDYVCSSAVTGACAAAGGAGRSVYYLSTATNENPEWFYEFIRNESVSYSLAACIGQSNFSNDADFYYYPFYVDTVSTSCVYQFAFVLANTDIDSVYAEGKPTNTLIRVQTVSGNASIKTGPHYNHAWDNTDGSPPGGSGSHPTGPVMTTTWISSRPFQFWGTSDGESGDRWASPSEAESL